MQSKVNSWTKFYFIGTISTFLQYHTVPSRFNGGVDSFLSEIKSLSGTWKNIHKTKIKQRHLKQQLV